MFITLEGIEGCGKSTQARHLAQWLSDTGRACLLTREPGATPIGRRIRSLLLDPDSGAIAPAAELFLYCADRAQHVRDVIRPALEEGRIVVCDRYVDATLAYQGYARGQDLDLIRQAHRASVEGLMPDLTILLDLPAAEGLARAWRQIRDGGRPRGESRFETEALVFHERVRAGYLALARQEPERYRVVDAAADEAAVRRQIQGVIPP
jgi:dTMP kinase